MLWKIIIVIFVGAATARVAYEDEPTNFIDNFYNLCKQGEETARCIGAWSKSNEEDNGCFKNNTCNKAAAVEYTETGIVFHLLAKDAEYVSIGFSADQKMGNDSVVSCVPSTGEAPLEGILSFNIGTDNFVDKSQDNFKLLEASISEPDMYCKFTLSNTLEFARRGGVPADNEFYVLAVAGEMHADGTIGHHMGRAYSDEKWDLSGATTAFLSLTAIAVSCFVSLI